VSLKDLKEKEAVLVEQMEAVQGHLSAVREQIIDTVAVNLDKVRGLQGKQFGAVNANIDKFDVTQTVAKKVTWDQEMLADIWTRIEAHGDNPSDFIKQVLKVAEKSYGNMEPEVQAIFAPARTIEEGATTYKFKAVS
jgi:hypothetical protein